MVAILFITLTYSAASAIPGFGTLSNPNDDSKFMVGFPFTFSGFQNFSIGTVLRAGPFFFGSSSVISTIIGKQIRNADGYEGLVFKLDKERQRY